MAVWASRMWMRLVLLLTLLLLTGVIGDFVSYGKWPNGEIVYEWSTEKPMMDKNRQAMLDAYTWLQDNTCLKFYHMSSSEARSVHNYQVSYQKLIQEKEGCWSFMGRKDHKPTITNLGPRCYAGRVAIHEVLHALGKLHEQSRFDRDRFIHLYYNNISSDKVGNYKKTEFSGSAVYDPYDILSVMHYGDTSFSKDWRTKKTMVVNGDDPTMHVIFEEITSRGVRPSHYDAQSVNLHYDCNSHCSPIHCKHGGFVDKNCQCRCVDVLGGPTCEEMDSSGIANTPGCGGEYRVMSAGDSYTFSEPTQQTLSPCAWLFTSELGTEIKIVVHKLNLGVNYDDIFEVRHLLPGQSGKALFSRWPMSGYVPAAPPTHTANSWKYGWNDYSNDPTIVVLIKPSTDPYSSSSSMFDFSATVTVTADSRMRHAYLSSDAEEDWPELWYIWESSRSAYDAGLTKSDEESAGGTYSLAISPSSGGTEWLQTKIQWDGSSGVCVDFEYYGTGSSSTLLHIQSVRRSDTSTHDTINDNSYSWTSHWSTVTESGWFAVRFSYGPGSYSSGDMYLDNVIIQECGYVPPPPATHAPPQTSPKSAFYDDFEYDFDTTWLAEGDGIWYQHSGKTSSTDTGPSDAFIGYYYAYLECTGHDHDTGTLTPIGTFFDGLRDVCVTFRYHMMGNTMGTFEVYRRDYQTGATTQVWSKGKNDIDPMWQKADFTIPATSTQSYLQVVFQATCGESYSSDIALDDVDLRSCDRGGGGGSPTAPPVTETITLDFEDEYTWNNDLINQGTLTAPYGSYDSTEYWSRRSGPTWSSMTGPNEAHGGQYYIYMEASSPNEQYQVAELILNRVLSTSEAADLDFWFHVYGEHMGDLQVLAIEHNGGRESIAWQRSESYEGWLENSMTIDSKPWPFQVMFRAIRGTDYESDIALDDITITIRGSGGSTDPVTPAPSSSDGPITLTFEDDYSWDSQFTNQGTLSNPTNGRHYWTRQSGPVPSGTGPDWAYAGNYYIYMPYRDNYSGQTAELVVNHVFQTSSIVDVTFWAYMDGSGVGSIDIYAVEDYGSGENMVFHTHGSWGSTWTEWYRPWIQDQSWPFKLLFRATLSWGDTNLAIDDITITTRPEVSHSPPERSHAPPDTPGHIEDKDLLLQSFEKDLYGFRVQDDTVLQKEKKWTGPDAVEPLQAHTGDTMTMNTGPVKASAGKYYLLFEAAGLSSGARASLVTKKNFEGNEEMCVLFDYHMYGSETGTLDVLSRDLDGNETSHWQVAGQNVNDWQEANVVVPPQPEIYQIVIRVTNGRGSEGDIGIDNVLLAKGPCKRITVGQHCQSCDSDYESNTTCHGEHLDGRPYCTAYGFAEDSLWNSVNCMMLQGYKNGYVSYRKTCVLPSCSLGYNADTDTDDVARTLHFTTDCMDSNSLNCEICCPDHCDASGAAIFLPHFTLAAVTLFWTLLLVSKD